ncbi:flagellar hook-length control protein FliK [Rhizobium rhizogenes]|uniref:flagellar hook-length control protein FliK n=1 Tax=Rhizobium rhizogenes TaxID=359 RepID=UPI000646AB23|nr:flagellar hook-length control protein FliK [Rhizobium rhizogenes]
MQDIGISSAPSGADLIAVAKGGRSAKQDDGAGKGFQDALTSSLGNGSRSGANANGDAGMVETGADADINADGGATQPADLAIIVSATGDILDTGAEMIDPSLANLANPATLAKGAKPPAGAKFPQEASAANLSKSLMDLQQAVSVDTAPADATKTIGDADTAQPQIQAADQLDDLAQQLAEVVVDHPSAETDGDGKTAPVKPGKTPPVTDDGKSLPTQNVQTGNAASDVLSLLNAQQAVVPVAPQSTAAALTGADVKMQVEPDKSLPKLANVASKDASVDADDTMAALPRTGDDTVAAAQTFRLVRADGRGGSLDMSISKGSDDAAQADITTSGSGNAQTVTVLDSRRYLGLAANSNAALVTSALGGNKDWSGAMQPGSALANAASWTSTGKVVNTLKIQLNPDNLGEVTATMRLSGDQLSVDLKVRTGEAYRQLHADQSHMVDALRAQGYQVDSITVTMAASGDQSSDGNKQSGFQGQSQQQSLMNQGQGGDARPKGQNYSGQQANGNDGNRSSGERGMDESAASYAQRLRSGDVYL